MPNWMVGGHASPLTGARPEDDVASAIGPPPPRGSHRILGRHCSDPRPQMPCGIIEPTLLLAPGQPGPGVASAPAPLVEQLATPRLANNARAGSPRFEQGSTGI